MRKALLVTHVSGFVPQFEMNNVRLLQKDGIPGALCQQLS